MATGAVTPNEIAPRIGLGGAADVQANLADPVRRVVPVTRRAEIRSRQVAYRIADPYLAFYFTILDPRRSLIQLGPSTVVDRSLSDDELDGYVSRVFEEVARQYVRRATAAGLLPIVQEVGSPESPPKSVRFRTAHPGQPGGRGPPSRSPRAGRDRSGEDGPRPDEGPGRRTPPR
jgi:hypothetical protein